jgi:phage FluMu protein Com
MNPLYATIEEFAADGYTHIECFCPRCRVIRTEVDELAPENLDGA